MRKLFSITAVIGVLALAGCGDTDLERGLSGAAIGVLGAELTGGNAASGAILGGAVGVLCDDLSPELCN
ncbi:MAG: hypothetical protein AAFN59_11635 [Pseudomonadota bacterium]